MKLSVDGKVNAGPENRDIERAVDEAPAGASRQIHLQSNGDDYIEAILDKDGRWRLSFVEDGERSHSADPVDRDTAKTVFVEYLNQDSDWRRECRFVAEDSDDAPSIDSARINARPPVWAIVLVAIAFFAFPLLSFLPDEWRARLPEGFGIVWLIAGPMTVMILAMIAHKLIQARRASRWPQAAGRVVKSEVAATRHQASGKATELLNLPLVEYEFSANGRKFTGTRISIGDDKGGANTEDTLAHYPVGATVMVYYDPKDPRNCVLEREIPKDVPKGCLAILLVLAAVGFGGYWLVTHALTWLGPYMDEDAGRIVVIATGFGLVVLMLFFGSRGIAKAGRNWPSVKGKVMESGTESYRRRVSRSTVTVYAPVVEYAYLVNGHEYRSRQIKLNDVEGVASLEDAKKTAARYPEGREVEVHYDPTNPGNAALEGPGRTAWLLIPIALLCFGVAIYESGVLG